MLSKIHVFHEEIENIKNSKIKELVMLTLTQIPDYFFEIPASSSGKYHPSYALREGGLVRHTKAACKIAKDVLELEQYECLGHEAKDTIFAALILHDGLKQGDGHSNHTIVEHPLEIAKLINSVNQKYKCVDENTLLSIVSAVESHMGQWNKNRSNKEVLPKPKTNIQKLVHLFDYLASRKYLIVDFGVDTYNRGKYEHDLRAAIDSLIETCKNKIASGIDAEHLYSIIEQYNEGQKNPKKITDINIAEFLCYKISSLE